MLDILGILFGLGVTIWIVILIAACFLPSQPSERELEIARENTEWLSRKSAIVEERNQPKNSTSDAVIQLGITTIHELQEKLGPANSYSKYGWNSDLVVWMARDHLFVIELFKPLNKTFAVSKPLLIQVERLAVVVKKDVIVDFC